MQQFESPVLEIWRNIVYIYIFISYSISILCMHARMCGYNNMYTMCNYIIIYISHASHFPGTNLGSVELVSRFLFCHAAMPSVAQHGFTVSVSRRSI